MTVRDVMDDLSHRPSTRAVSRVELLVGQAGAGIAKTRRQLLEIGERGRVDSR
jgi:hypothetical protein